MKARHNGRRKASALGKTGAERSAYVMNPKYLAEIEHFRLMDDTFMSKCLENAPECIELILKIILGKKDLKVVKSQTEYPIKSLQGRGIRFDVFARDSKGKEYDIEIQRENDGAEPKRARYNSALMDANALKSGDPPPKPIPLFSRISFDVNNYRFFVDAKMRCRYNGNDKFMYRHNHPFTSSTNVYFEIGTVLNVTDTRIIYGSSTNMIGSKSCFLIEGKNHPRQICT